jgi:hypothetical protein
LKTNNKTRHKAPRTIITNKKEITKHNMKTQNEEQRTRSLKPKKRQTQTKILNTKTQRQMNKEHTDK